MISLGAKIVYDMYNSILYFRKMMVDFSCYFPLLPSELYVWRFWELYVVKLSQLEVVFLFLYYFIVYYCKLFLLMAM